MRSATLCLFAVAGGLLVGSTGACGGRVIVDGTAGQGGAGGMPPGTSGSGSTTWSGPGCNFPEPVGATVNCSAAASSGAGTPVSCVVATCDDDHNQFVSSCTTQSCICSYSPANGTESFGCACSNTVSCEDDGRNCCPFPF